MGAILQVARPVITLSSNLEEFLSWIQKDTKDAILENLQAAKDVLMGLRVLA